VEAVDVAHCDRDEVTNDDDGVDHVVDPSWPTARLDRGHTPIDSHHSAELRFAQSAFFDFSEPIGIEAKVSEISHQ
jgi:hypothetical protein